MNLYDQARWQAAQLWRQTTESAAYWWEQLFAVPNAEPTENVNWLEPIARWLALILMGLVLGIGLLLLGRWLWRKWLKSRLRGQPGSTPRLTAPRPVKEWLLQAQHCQANGDYAGACRAYYMALILRLRAAEWLSRTEALTNGEYWRQLEAAWAMGQHPSRVRHPIQRLFQTHTQLFYGGQAISRETMEQCREAYFQVEPDLTRPTP